MLISGADSAVALVDADSGETLTYRDLRGAVERFARKLPRERTLAFMYPARSAGALAAYLALLEARYPVAVMNPDSPSEMTARLTERYRPGIAVSAETGWEPAPTGHAPVPLHPDLALLLSTSGSTGTPKLVRLSAGNVLANARAVCASLGIHAGDRTITSLPLSYSYGLSVVHSHMLAGAAIVVVDAPIIEQRFWTACADHGGRSLHATPTGLRVLWGASIAPGALEGFRYVSSAGGRLPVDLNRRIADDAAEYGFRFHNMYGQTEACARITCMPPDAPSDKLGSVGLPLAGGAVAIRSADAGDLPTGEIGRIWYRGPNVMMGYAFDADDLARGDEQGEWLDTGDIGRLDPDGYLWVTGREARFAKPLGIRVSLDDIEHLLSEHAAFAAVEQDDVVHVAHTQDGFDAAAGIKRLTELTGIPALAFRFHHVDAIPTLPNGKVDYQQLKATVTSAAVPAAR
jgi:acyl-CoA synthetase (AMP-forming)/AMP-acid ligase II